MKTVILEVRAPKDAMTSFAQAWKTGKQQKSARISFASPELLWKVLTAKRWELLKALCGVGPVSIREAARRAWNETSKVYMATLWLFWMPVCWFAQKAAKSSFRTRR